jgi:ATP-dependent DNA helicase RecQ
MPINKDEFGLKQTLKSFFGFSSFKGNQEKVIESLLHGNNTFVVMPTGGGKSLCYQLPAISQEGTAIVVSPLIALMKNQVDMIRNFSNDRSIAHVMNSSLSKNEMNEVRTDLLAGKTKLLYMAPESLTKEDNILFLRKINISFYAIDEAHCISEWGHDFRPEYRKLRPIIKAIGFDVPIIALTATATLKVQEDILKNLEIPKAQVFKSSFDRTNLYYEVRPKTKNVVKDIIKYIKTQPNKSGIIYCLSRKKVEEIAESLVVNGIRALPYHAGLDAASRRNNQDDFLMENVEVIVATIAFGMGIDKPDIRFVIHHDIPKSIEGYYQETGRGGRDGGEGNCITFYSYDDIQKLEKFTKDKPVAEQEIAKELLFETVAYAESSVCRHRTLLHYFGEGYTKDNCGACDNCLTPKEKFEGQEDIKLVINVVNELKQQFKAKLIADFIAGNKSGDVKSIKLDKHKLFASGVESSDDRKHWMTIIRQALINKFIDKEIENYGILKVCEKGLEYIENPYSILLAKDHDYESSDDDSIVTHGGGQKNSGSDNSIFLMLKDLRKDLSKKENLPPFVIFQDPSLEDMSIQYPITMEELQQIIGVGAGKARKYGEPFLNLIKQYVEDNDITRPNDMVIKSVINKSGLKVYIIRSIDRKLPLPDIAYAKNLSVEELLTEIERIVSSGTKVDIDYYITEHVDEYHQEEIYDYFSEAETDSILEALDELGEAEFNEEEVRLMRIKFLSEVGN